MEAKELRVGNIVRKGNMEYVADFITIQMAHNYEPIPLTPEILEKSGFEKIEFEEYAFITPFARKRLVLRFNDNGPDQINTHWIENVGMEEVSLTFDIQYLHELQNLYFALFQKEIEIKL